MMEMCSSFDLHTTGKNWDPSLNPSYLGLSLNLDWRHRHGVVYFCVLCGNVKHSELRKWSYEVAFNMRMGKRLRRDDVIHHLFKSAGITFLHCSNWCLKENSGVPFWKLQIKDFTTVEMSSSQKWKWPLRENCSWLSPLTLRQKVCNWRKC